MSHAERKAAQQAEAQTKFLAECNVAREVLKAQGFMNLDELRKAQLHRLRIGPGPDRPVAHTDR